MKMTEIITTEEAREGFFPTPQELAAQMLEDVDWRMIHTILEPSAGKGDLVLSIAREYHKYDRYGRRDLDVDAVEADPYLRQICKFNFSAEKLNELYKSFRALDDMRYDTRAHEQEAERKRLREEIDTLKTIDLHMVHDDFLT